MSNDRPLLKIKRKGLSTIKNIKKFVDKDFKID